jgi:putative aldouronate transport system permease protein
MKGELMTVSKNQQVESKKKKKIRWGHIIPFYVMVLPGALYLLINNYIPMYGIIIAFKKLNFQKGVFQSEWSGFDNFRFLFATKDAWTITRNTILYNIAFFIVGTVMAITLAILINEIRNRFASKVYQSLTLLPFLMSWVVISYLVYAFLSAETGLINNSILEPIGMKNINWYQEKKYWPFILILVNTWKGLGYSMIIYLSSIVGISQDYFEAARLDGASKWKQIKHITLPLLKPTLITLFILSVGQIFRSDFGLFYQIPKNSGPLFDVTRTLDVYVYQALMKNSDYTMSSAASVYQSIVGFVLIIAANQIIRKYNKESALF